MPALSKNPEEYILSHIGKEDPVLYELNRDTYINVLYPRMISGHLQGKILSMLSSMIAPQRILELGTFTGYSAICLAKTLPEGGELHTIEINDELEEFAARYFGKAGLAQKIIQHIGDAGNIIPQLEGCFDLVFLDANKRKYCEHYNLVFPKVPVGGYIIADNTLWNNKVVEVIDPSDEQTKGIFQFNELIKNDTRVEKVILPFRDGMTLIRKLDT